MLKNKRIVRIMIMVFATIIATGLYLGAFDIDESNMAVKLSKHFQNENLSIIDRYEMDGNAGKDLVVYCASSGSRSVALLHKGLNGKYLISDSHQTDREIDGISFLIAGSDYTVIYGKSDMTIAKMNFVSGVKPHIETLDSKNIFLVRESRGYDGIIEVTYIYNPDAEPKQVSVQTSQGSTWKSITVPLRSILILILSYLATSLLRRKYDSDLIKEYTGLPQEGQSIRQSWYR